MLQDRFTDRPACQNIDVDILCFRWHKIPSMEEKRYYSDSAITPEGNLWIIGGTEDSDEVKRTSEYISAHDGSQEDGPELPIGLASHVVVKVNETTSMLIGGFIGGNNTRERSHTKCIGSLNKKLCTQFDRNINYM